MSTRRRRVGSGVVLIGMRGVGKSTVGRALATRMGLPFIDLDRRIERRAGATVSKLFATRGEPRFRQLETAVLREVGGRRRRGVLATGGGVVERAENDALLRRLGTIVWLQIDGATIRARIAANRERPALLGADPVRELKVLAARRAPRYRELADIVVRCGDATPSELAERITRRLCSSTT